MSCARHRVRAASVKNESVHLTIQRCSLRGDTPCARHGGGPTSTHNLVSLMRNTARDRRIACVSTGPCLCEAVGGRFWGLPRFAQYAKGGRSSWMGPSAKPLAYKSVPLTSGDRGARPSVVSPYGRHDVTGEAVALDPAWQVHESAMRRNMPNKRASHSAVLKHKRGDDRELHISHIPESPPLHASSPPVCPNEGSIGRVQEHTIASTIAEVTQLATTHTTADSSPMLSPGSDPEKRVAQKGVVGKHCLVSQTASAQILGGADVQSRSRGQSWRRRPVITYFWGAGRCRRAFFLPYSGVCARVYFSGILNRI